MAVYINIITGDMLIMNRYTIMKSGKISNTWKFLIMVELKEMAIYLMDLRIIEDIWVYR